MYIKKILGTFGTLKDIELDFDDGLNIIVKDNEWGKTTLISFIKTMFYGLNTSKRDRKEYLSEKTKYVHSGVFSGEMIINNDDEDITVIRGKNGKSNVFNCYFTETGLKAKYKSSDFGKSLLSINEDSFSNSALIEFDNRLISNSDELENLIISMTTTGDTSGDFNKAYKNLKLQKSSIQKSSGTLESDKKQLIELNYELLSLDEIQKELNALKKEEEDKKVLLSDVKTNYEAYFKEVSRLILEEEERANIIKAEAEARISVMKEDYFDDEAINKLENAYKSYEENKSLEYKYRVLSDELLEKNYAEKEKINIDKEQKIKEFSKVSIRKIPFVLAFVFGLLSVSTLFMNMPSEILMLVFSALSILSLIFSFKKTTIDESVLKNFDDNLQKLDEKLEEAQKNHENFANSLKISIEFLEFLLIEFKILDSIDFTNIPQKISYFKDVNIRYKKALEFKNTTKDDYKNIYSKEKIINANNKLEELKVSLKDKTDEYNNVLKDLIRLETKMSAFRPKAKLLEMKKEIDFRISKDLDKLIAIDYAIDALNLANERLTARLSPEISEKASDYFAFLTDNRYDTVILQKELEAFCKSKDDFNLLDKLRLSSGTKEQLYFALRLAICDVLIEKNIPIILDDPFVFYDEKRMKKALDLLAKLAENRQIVLLTCHNREKNYLDKL